MEQRFETFTALVTGISRVIRKIKTEEMAEFHLKGPHVSCLYYLYKEGTLTAKALCDLCDVDKANMSRILEFLEKNGYIVYAKEAHRRYRAPLMLTEEGKAVGGHIAEKIDRVLLAASEGVSEEDRLILYERLKKIYDNLIKVCKGYSKKQTKG